MRKKIYKTIERPKRWLSERIAKTYIETYESVLENTGEIKGEAHEVIRAFVNECGITELEAINIVMRKISVKEIVAKYKRRRAEYEAFLKAPEDAIRKPRVERMDPERLTKWRERT